MKRAEQLRLLEGLHTVETVAETLRITPQAALIFSVNLKKNSR